MPKFKPVKGILKRMRVTKNGKVVCRSAGRAHRRAVKSAKRLRRLHRTHSLHPRAAKLVRKLVGK